MEHKFTDLSSSPPDGEGVECKFQSGYIALLGRPNVGKSTLLNRLVGTKLAIVSRKPQTTRNRILGVRTEDDCQFIFLDTPGIHKPRERFNKVMVRQALGALDDADVGVVILECGKPLGAGDQFILDRVRENEIPFVAVLNKIDLLKPEQLQKTWDQFTEMTKGASEQIAISALRNSGIVDLLKILKGLLPNGPKLYPDDTITDRSQKFQMSEIIREKVFELTREELPYATAVQIQSIEEKAVDQPLVIHALVAVDSPSQKAIMIGKNGEMAKKIGIRARKDIELLVSKQVFLEIRVEVVKDWRSRATELERFGYHEEW